MNTRWLLLVATLALPAYAQRVQDDDAPIPYPEDDVEEERTTRKLPRRSDPTVILREESDWEQQEREEVLAVLDDPNIGLSGELVTGLLLLDSARGAGVESGFCWGLRFTWEWSRLFSDEWLRESFFADALWSYTGYRAGTSEVFADTNYHYFTVAPAWAFPFGQKSAFAGYLQAGVGLSYQYSAVHVAKVETNIGGTKLLLQYGAGIRGRPALLPDESIRLSFRIELTRFRRGYMDDTFLGGGVGLTF